MKNPRKKSLHAISRKSLLRVIDIYGSERLLGKKLGVVQQTISKWLERGIPASRVICIEKAASGLVTRHDLRPDIYPKD
jgi:DNA-binding transcriptional regulator YdaS (Cro superfamily)